MKTIKNNDDPRLTAYALGELDAGERAAVEAFLVQSPSARSVVEETRALAGLLTAELGTEGAPGLTDAHHQAIDAALDEGTVRGATVLQLRLWIPAAAAVLIVGVVAWQLGLGERVLHVARPSPESAGVALKDGPLDALQMARRERESLRAVGYPTSGHAPEGAAVKAGDDARSKRDDYTDSDGSDAETGSRLQKNEPQKLAMPGVVDELRSDDRAFDKAQVSTPSSVAVSQEDAASDALGVQLGRQLEGDAKYPMLVDSETPKEQVGAIIVGGQAGVRSGRGHAGNYRGPSDASAAGSGVFPPTNPGGASGAGPVLAGAAAAGSAAGPQDKLKASGAAPAATGAGRTARGGSDRGSASTGAPQAAPARPATQPAPAPVAKGVSPAREALAGLAALGYVDGVDAAERKRALGEQGYLTDGARRSEGELALRLRRETGGESYATIHENPFVPLTSDPVSRLSTFGVDVDTASYANVRRFLNMGQVPPPDAVRLEELLNYFSYDDPAPGDEDELPFAVSVESAAAPWAPAHRLVRVALKGAEHAVDERPASNLVFLLDVSGSMNSSDKLPLLVASLKLLLGELDGDDRVAIVTYASGTRLVLPSTPCSDKPTILAALDNLRASGSTHASAGIQQAYEVASQGFLAGGINRVLLATDGDFNVGITEEGDLEQFIASKARGGVFLTVLGFGTGNLQDSKAEVLADHGNGNYAYIDTLNEAHKVLVRELGGTLVTIAKDVKLQVEFNPGKVAAYRQLGYENRALAATDFRDDRKDAGELGAGHSVVALYEIVPVGVSGVPGTADLRYGAAAPEAGAAPLVESDELLTVNLRYKLPEESTGRELAVPFIDGGAGFGEASVDFRFSAAVASFGMVLRHSAYQGETSLAGIASVADAARGDDRDGYRSEFVRLVRVAQGLPGF